MTDPWCAQYVENVRVAIIDEIVPIHDKTEDPELVSVWFSPCTYLGLQGQTGSLTFVHAKAAQTSEQARHSRQTPREP